MPGAAQEATKPGIKTEPILKTPDISNPAPEKNKPQFEKNPRRYAELRAAVEANKNNPDELNKLKEDIGEVT